MKKVFFGLVFGLLCTYAQASTCGNFYRNIDSAVKELSAEESEDFLDDSAARATMRNSRMTAMLGNINVLLTQMAQLKCPVPVEPIWYADYLSAATECTLAKREGKIEEAKTKCDRDTWRKVRNGRYVD